MSLAEAVGGLRDLLQKLRFVICPPVFEVVIRDHVARVQRGKVSKAFLDDCTGIAGENSIGRARLFGVKREYGVGLEFSSQVSASSRQRFRNVWNVHGR